jgi:7-keto-8-aminopelargonate synthetase-like enzyme
MGTLSKGLGAIGGYIAGRKELIEFLRIAARGYMFATAFPPHIAAAVIEAIRVIQHDDSLIRRLHSNSDYLRNGLQERGFNTLLSETQIIPVLVGDEKDAICFSRELYDRGFLTGCARWPAVPKGNARIRLSLMATHTQDHLDRLMETLTELGRKIGIIR